MVYPCYLSAAVTKGRADSISTNTPEYPYGVGRRFYCSDETLQKAILRAMGPYGDGLWRRRYCCCYGLLAAVRWRGPIAKVRCGRTAVIVMLMIALVVYCSLFWSGRDFRIRLVVHARAPRRPTVCFDPRCMNRSGAVAGFSGAGCARDRACSCSGLVGTSTC